MNKNLYECAECAAQYVKWSGVCRSCNVWNSLIKLERNGNKNCSDNVFCSTDISIVNEEKLASTFKNFDKMFSGGTPVPSTILFFGAPGVGKTTFLFDLLFNIAKCNDVNCLYISTEESISQIGNRFLRNRNDTRIFIGRENDLANIFSSVKRTNSRVVIIDSIQLLIDKNEQIFNATTNNSKLIVNRIIEYSQQEDVCFIMVNQVLKDGKLAGAKYIEHIVDVVLSVENVSPHENKIHLYSKKNRFGSSNAMIMFELINGRLVEKDKHFVNYPLFRKDSVGLARGLYLMHSKIYFFEIHTLVIKNNTAPCTRITSGYPKNRLNFLLAIIQNYFSISLESFDIYLNVVGSDATKENSSDSAVLISLLSSFLNKKCLANQFFSGEISLLGDILPSDINPSDLNVSDEINIVISKQERDKNNCSGINTIFDLVCASGLEV